MDLPLQFKFKWKFGFAFRILILAKWPLQNFAHAMAAQLCYHGIGKVSIEFELGAKKIVK